MQQARDNDTYIIRVDVGEEVNAVLVDFCIKEGINNAAFSGLGAVSSLSCGYYSLAEKKYHFRKYDEMLEIASLTGNIALKEGKPFIHMHGVFTDTSNNAFGGHVERMTAGIVVEIILHRLGSSITREYDENTGLALLACGQN